MFAHVKAHLTLYMECVLKGGRCLFIEEGSICLKCAATQVFFILFVFGLSNEDQLDASPDLTMPAEGRSIPINTASNYLERGQP